MNSKVSSAAAKTKNNVVSSPPHSGNGLGNSNGGGSSRNRNIRGRGSIAAAMSAGSSLLHSTAATATIPPPPSGNSAMATTSGHQQQHSNASDHKSSRGQNQHHQNQQQNQQQQQQRGGAARRRLWVLFLGAGTVLCLADIWYIANYLDQSLQNTIGHVNGNGGDSGSELFPSHKNNKNINDINNKNNNNNNNKRSAQQRENINGDNQDDPDDKARIVALLKDAGIDMEDLDPDHYARLPTWSQVTALYGSEPILYGYPQACEKFQHANVEFPDPADHFIATAGTFNTGTNLLSELLAQNCHMPERMKKYGHINKGIRWQVPWGKHTPVDDEQYRMTHKSAGDHLIHANQILPVVTIREPSSWMSSMCRHPYAMKGHDEYERCPKLVESDTDPNSPPIPVHIKYSNTQRSHESILHHWNDWYMHYYTNQNFPFLMIRYEDLIFHAKYVTKTVCECAGGVLIHGDDDKRFKYIVSSAKKGAAHGAEHEKTGYIDAMIHYGTDPKIWQTRMSAADRAFAAKHLQPELMQTFRYPYPPNDNDILMDTDATPEQQQQRQHDAKDMKDNTIDKENAFKRGGDGEEDNEAEENGEEGEEENGEGGEEGNGEGGEGNEEEEGEGNGEEGGEGNGEEGGEGNEKDQEEKMDDTAAAAK